MSAAVYTGIPLALVTTSAFNSGLILEKRALGTMPPLDLRKVAHVIVTLLTSPAWLAGFALMLSGLACQIIVLTFEPISVVQPILASGIVLTVVLSRLVLHERLGGAEFWCVAAMVVSLVLLALSQGGTGTQSGQHDSVAAVLAVMLPSIAAGLLIAGSPLRTRPGRHRAPVGGICYGIGCGLLYGVASLATKGLSGIITHDHTAVGIAAGILFSPYLYVLGGCSVAALLLYQAALQACRASILVPVSTVASSVYFLIAGTWLFHEHLPASPAKLAERLAGIAMAGLVVIVLARQNPAPQPVSGDTARGTAVTAGRARILSPD